MTDAQFAALIHVLYAIREELELMNVRNAQR